VVFKTFESLSGKALPRYRDSTQNLQDTKRFPSKKDNVLQKELGTLA
jgi:hypothetical protein